MQVIKLKNFDIHHSRQPASDDDLIGFYFTAGPKRGFKVQFLESYLEKILVTYIDHIVAMAKVSSSEIDETDNI